MARYIRKIQEIVNDFIFGRPVKGEVLKDPSFKDYTPEDMIPFEKWYLDFIGPKYPMMLYV